MFTLQVSAVALSHHTRQADIANGLDDWRREQDDLPSLAEAIRRLIQLGLKAKAR
jgi:hypothetical protein